MICVGCNMHPEARGVKVFDQSKHMHLDGTPSIYTHLLGHSHFWSIPRLHSSLGRGSLPESHQTLGKLAQLLKDKLEGKNRNT